MAYQALYRKWRPLVFDDVVGQEHITKTLKNEIINGKAAHAYLFCGTRGTGKTSTAKILARALNCQNPVCGNPCNECDACRGILSDSVMDVIELDAASRTSVNDIRQIIDEVSYPPSSVRKKVYIIDEVHMISGSAFNALLKTLEEPPEYVTFILATTELHKIPATVLSRCQRFDFRRITNTDIVSRMKIIIESDGYSASDDALSLIAELGDGSMRDSLSVLDQILSYKANDVTYNDVINIIGIADNSSLYDICTAIAGNDSEAVLTVFDEVILNGKEISAFVESLVKFLRDILIVKLTKNPQVILSKSDEQLQKIKELSDLFTKEKLINGLRLLNDSVTAAKYSTFSRTVFELAFIKLTDPSADDNIDAISDRLSSLEKQISKGGFEIKQTPKKEKSTEINTVKKEKTKKNEETPKNTTEAISLNTSAITSHWNEILSEIKNLGGMPVWSHVISAKATEHKNKLILVYDESSLLSKNIISKPSNIELISNAVKNVTGISISVSCHSQKEMGDISQNNSALSELEELSKKHNVIEII